MTDDDKHNHFPKLLCHLQKGSDNALRLWNVIMQMSALNCEYFSTTRPLILPNVYVPRRRAYHANMRNVPLCKLEQISTAMSFFFFTTGLYYLKWNEFYAQVLTTKHEVWENLPSVFISCWLWCYKTYKKIRVWWRY